MSLTNELKNPLSVKQVFSKTALLLALAGTLLGSFQSQSAAEKAPEETPKKPIVSRSLPITLEALNSDKRVGSSPSIVDSLNTDVSQIIFEFLDKDTILKAMDVKWAMRALGAEEIKKRLNKNPALCAEIIHGPKGVVLLFNFASYEHAEQLSNVYDQIPLFPLVALTETVWARESTEWKPQNGGFLSGRFKNLERIIETKTNTAASKALLF